MNYAELESIFFLKINKLFLNFLYNFLNKELHWANLQSHDILIRDLWHNHSRICAFNGTWLLALYFIRISVLLHLNSHPVMSTADWENLNLKDTRKLGKERQLNSNLMKCITATLIWSFSKIFLGQTRQGKQKRKYKWLGAVGKECKKD